MLEVHAVTTPKAPPAAPADRVDDFHAHLDVCPQCEQHPFDLCATGARLLLATVPGAAPAASSQPRAPDCKALRRVEDEGRCPKASSNSGLRCVRFAGHASACRFVDDVAGVLWQAVADAMMMLPSHVRGGTDRLLFKGRAWIPEPAPAAPEAQPDAETEGL